MDDEYVEAVEPYDQDVEDLCKCGKPGLSPHPCPYVRELYEDEIFMCNCCDDCRNECARDI